MSTDRRTETAELVQRAYLLLLRALAREHAGSPDQREVGDALKRAADGDAELCFHLACTGSRLAYLAEVCDPLSDAAVTLARFDVVPGDTSMLPH